MKKLCVFSLMCSGIFLAGCDLIPPKNDALVPTTTVNNEEITQTTVQVPNTVTVKPTLTTENSGGVPLPTGQDIVRTFFSLINEKRIPEAISMMDQIAVPDDSAKQAWGVQFNYMSQVIVKSIVDYNKTNWTETEQTFKVTLTMKMNPDSVNAPIPYYGYDNGDNIRWATIKKNSDNLWKLMGIATGP